MNEDEKLFELLTVVLELNTTLAKQNALIVQALTLPHLLIKGEQDEE